MISLKKIKLVNYCGFKDFELDFTDGQDVKKWAMFYGPNGSFKSTLLRAIDLLASPIRFFEKNNVMTFRRLKHHRDYAYGVEAMYTDANGLKMEAVFFDGEKDKTVIFEDNIKGIIYAGRKANEEKGEISGVRLNELEPCEEGIVFIDADNRNMMHKFQIIKELQDPFCDFAAAVYGFNCYCPAESLVNDPSGINYLMDFVIEKPGGMKVHYKRFSDGEKKIATLVSSLFKRVHKDSPDKEGRGIIALDNIAMHIYFKRHMELIRKIEEYFPEQQIIATTHSPVIINEMDKKYLINME